jgi:hypothetical protein
MAGCLGPLVVHVVCNLHATRAEHMIHELHSVRLRAVVLLPPWNQKKIRVPYVTRRKKEVLLFRIIRLTEYYWPKN